VNTPRARRIAWRELLRALWLPLPLAVIAVVETAVRGGDDVVLDCALAGTTVLGLVLRHRQPGLAAAWVATGMALEAAVTESPDQAGVLLAFIVSAFFVVGAPSRREAVLGLGMLGLAVTVTIALDPSDSLSNVPPTLLLFLVLPAGLGFAFAQRGRALVGMGQDNERLRVEAAAAVDAERRRLSHELHDVVSHAVTLIAISAEAGATVVRSDPPAAERAFGTIADTSRDALGELQALLALLHTEETTGSGTGLHGLEALVEGVRASGATVDLVYRRMPPPLAPEADLAGYRVVQEALTNAMRHSRSPQMEVEVDEGGDGVTLRVTSRGAPHRSTYGGTGRGLVGLRERVEALGGRLDAGPVDDGAFVVSALIPRVAS
jgi:signal transduction histidine kinase